MIIGFILIPFLYVFVMAGFLDIAVTSIEHDEPIYKSPALITGYLFWLAGSAYFIAVKYGGVVFFEDQGGGLSGFYDIYISASLFFIYFIIRSNVDKQREENEHITSGSKKDC